MKRLMICFIMLLTITVGYAQSQITLIVSPLTAMIDAPVSIRVEGLAAQTPIMVRNFITDVQGVDWEAHAEFTADENGVVDVNTNAPQAGTYEGVDPLGLFWSMQPQADTYPVFVPADGDWMYTIRVELAGETSAETNLTRQRAAPDVVTRQADVDGVHGTLYIPAGTAPFATVMMLGGSEGGRPSFMASLMAAHGFAVFAVAYFREDGLPGDLIEVPLETFDAALAWLRQQPEVDRARIGLWGTSKGAEAALLVAGRDSTVCAVVAVAPSHVMWEGLPSNPMQMMNRETITSSWTLGGTPTAFVPQVLEMSDFMAYLGGSVSTRESFVLGLEQTDAVSAARIPVEQIGMPVLLIAGGDDQLIPSALMADAILEARNAANLPTEYLLYPQAGHALNAFYVPTLGLRDGAGLVLGGTPSATAHASVEAWAGTIEFFTRQLATACI